MEAIFQSSPRAAEMHASLVTYKAAANSSNVRSINGLLSYLECGEMPAAIQPPGLSVQLRSYQLQSLKFMVDSERRDGGFRSLFWVNSSDIGNSSNGSGVDATAGAGDATTAGPSSSSAVAAAASTSSNSLVAPTPPAVPYFYSPVFKRLSLKVQPSAAGGFLAEEMGLGKTVEVLGLVLSCPAPSSVVAGASFKSSYQQQGKILVVSRATLVVCAVSLVGQWVDEAMSKSAGSLRILSVSSIRIHISPCSLSLPLSLFLLTLLSPLLLQYHGHKREQDFKKISLGYDLVVTTYETLGSDYGQTLKGDTDKGKRKGQGHPLGDIHWHRIVFDEGHMVKSGEDERERGRETRGLVYPDPDLTLLPPLPYSCCSEGQGLHDAQL